MSELRRVILSTLIHKKKTYVEKNSCVLFFCNFIFDNQF